MRCSGSPGLLATLRPTSDLSAVAPNPVPPFGDATHVLSALIGSFEAGNSGLRDFGASVVKVLRTTKDRELVLPSTQGVGSAIVQCLYFFLLGGKVPKKFQNAYVRIPLSKSTGFLSSMQSEGAPTICMRIRTQPAKKREEPLNPKP